MAGNAPCSRLPRLGFREGEEEKREEKEEKKKEDEEKEFFKTAMAAKERRERLGSWKAVQEEEEKNKDSAEKKGQKRTADQIISKQEAEKDKECCQKCVLSKGMEGRLHPGEWVGPDNSAYDSIYKGSMELQEMSCRPPEKKGRHGEEGPGPRPKKPAEEKTAWPWPWQQQEEGVILPQKRFES